MPLITSMQTAVDFHQLYRQEERVYTFMRDLKLLGVAFGRRMVVIEHPDGGLMVQSPFVPDRETLEELKELGELRAAVVPTLFHDTFLKIPCY